MNAGVGVVPAGGAKWYRTSGLYHSLWGEPVHFNGEGYAESLCFVVDVGGCEGAKSGGWGCAAVGVEGFEGREVAAVSAVASWADDASSIVALGVRPRCGAAAEHAKRLSGGSVWVPRG